MWFRVDDRLTAHPKVRQAGLEAMGLWVVSGAWSSAYLTDGVIPRWYVDGWPSGPKLAKKLVGAGLWITHAEGWQFHEWEQWNPTRDDVEAERKSSRERQARWRASRRDRRIENRRTNAVTGTVTDGVSHAVTDTSLRRVTDPAPSRPVPITDPSAVTAQEAGGRSDGSKSDESATLRAGLGTIMQRLDCDEVWASKTAARFDAMAGGPIKDHDAYYAECIRKAVKANGLASLLPTPTPGRVPRCTHGVPLAAECDRCSDPQPDPLPKDQAIAMARASLAGDTATADPADPDDPWAAT